MTLRNEMLASPLPPDFTKAESVDGSLAKIGFNGSEIVSSGTDADGDVGGVGVAGRGAAGAVGRTGAGAGAFAETGGGAEVVFLAAGDGGGGTGFAGASGSARLNLPKKLLIWLNIFS